MEVYKGKNTPSSSTTKTKQTKATPEEKARPTTEAVKEKKVSVLKNIGVIVALLAAVGTGVGNIPEARNTCWKVIQSAGAAIEYTVTFKGWDKLQDRWKEIWNPEAKAEQEKVSELQQIVDSGAPQIDADTVSFYNSNSSKGTNPTDEAAAYSFVSFKGSDNLEYNIEITSEKNGKVSTTTLNTYDEKYDHVWDYDSETGTYTIKINNSGNGIITNFKVETIGVKLEDGELTPDFNKTSKAVIINNEAATTVSESGKDNSGVNTDTSTPSAGGTSSGGSSYSDEIEKYDPSKNLSQVEAETKKPETPVTETTPNQTPAETKKPETPATETTPSQTPAETGGKNSSGADFTLGK